ncbi:DUF6779 domain-containing protein [Actinokineospora pegani]|uniref:DUF6779 domain-containing protein n=1 Tax=Actinokineospora pegani TaxID=2654637 RepID=UPI0012EA6E5D|nr:DUF6779 domain-containing protein [Actinokineospora pegani]
MTDSSGERDDRAPMARLLLVAGLVLAAGATAVLVFGESLKWMRLGVVAALWAALAGTFVAARYRKQAADRAASTAELRKVYELELEREVAARREFELETAAEAKRTAEEKSAADLHALRSELKDMRDYLQSLLGGEVLVERIALHAEAIRMRGLAESGTGGPGNLRRLTVDQHAIDPHDDGWFDRDNVEQEWKPSWDANRRPAAAQSTRSQPQRQPDSPHAAPTRSTPNRPGAARPGQADPKRTAAQPAPSAPHGPGHTTPGQPEPQRAPGQAPSRAAAPLTARRRPIADARHPSDAFPAVANPGGGRPLRTDEVANRHVPAEPETSTFPAVAPESRPAQAPADRRPVRRSTATGAYPAPQADAPRRTPTGSFPPVQPPARSSATTARTQSADFDEPRRAPQDAADRRRSATAPQDAADRRRSATAPQDAAEPRRAPANAHSAPQGPADPRPATTGAYPAPQNPVEPRRAPTGTAEPRRTPTGAFPPVERRPVQDPGEGRRRTHTGQEQPEGRRRAPTGTFPAVPAGGDVRQESGRHAPVEPAEGRRRAQTGTFPAVGDPGRRRPESDDGRRRPTADQDEGRRRADTGSHATPPAEQGGSHAQGKSVEELLAAHGATTAIPRRHRRRAED